MHACMHTPATRASICKQIKQSKATYVAAEHVLLEVLHVVVRAGLDVVLWLLVVWGVGSGGVPVCGDRRALGKNQIRVCPPSQPIQHPTYVRAGLDVVVGAGLDVVVGAGLDVVVGRLHVLDVVLLW